MDEEYIERQVTGLQVNRRILELDEPALTDEYWQGKAETNYENILSYAEDVDSVEPGEVETLLDDQEYDEALNLLT